MKEFEIINIIREKLNSKYIGDDCAYLKDVDIVITQDSLVENIHFKRDWCTPFQLGYKSVVVNLSDILASGAEPKYVSIALSLPNNISKNFIKEFYDGAQSALNGAEIVGGDITGSLNDIVVSITAIGSANGRNISSRKHAKPGYIVVTRGNYGSSAAGLESLICHSNNTIFIKEHLEPKIDFEFSKTLSLNITDEYAMMDSSDDLVDALYKIAEASNVKIIVDFSKIRHLNEVTNEQVLFGGEDYNLIAAIPSDYANILNNIDIIGYVKDYDGIRLDISGEHFNSYAELNVYNHFE